LADRLSAGIGIAWQVDLTVVGIHDVTVPSIAFNRTALQVQLQYGGSMVRRSRLIA
jgi:hypothetical protein